MAPKCPVCKFNKRTCPDGCIFAPYFAPEDEWKCELLKTGRCGYTHTKRRLEGESPSKRENAINRLLVTAHEHVESIAASNRDRISAASLAVSAASLAVSASVPAIPYSSLTSPYYYGYHPASGSVAETTCYQTPQSVTSTIPGYDPSFSATMPGYDQSFSATMPGYDQSYSATMPGYDQSFSATMRGYDPSFSTYPVTTYPGFSTVAATTGFPIN